MKMKLDKGAIFASMAIIALASVFAGAGTMAWFSDVEGAGLGFRSGTLDLELGEHASVKWVTPPNWAPGDTAEVSVDLHIKSLWDTGIPAKSLIVHIFVDETGNIFTTEPEEKVAGQYINDLDSKIAIVDASFDIIGDGEDPIDIFDELLEAFDENGDDEIKLPEIVCHEWDVLDMAGIEEMVPSTWYTLYLTFKFQEDAGNEYQADYCEMSIEFMANQLEWNPDEYWDDYGMTTWCISVDGFIDENEYDNLYWFEEINDGVELGFAFDNKFGYLAFIVEEEEPTWLYVFMDTKEGGSDIEYGGLDSGADYELLDPDQSMVSYGVPCYLSKWITEGGEFQSSGWSVSRNIVYPHEWMYWDCEGVVGVKNFIYFEYWDTWVSIYEFKIPLECIEFEEFPYAYVVLDVGGTWYGLGL